MSPKLTVTVLMSVYNEERYLDEAIRSILNQTFTDFEFIIINDGSTDGTLDILRKYEQVDSRILVHNQANRGLTASLNRGGELANGKYIARMDADDISTPNRLERQVCYFNDHPYLALLGTWAEAIDERGRILWKICPPADPILLKWRMLFKNNIIHSSVMFNKEKSINLGGYNPNIAFAQDYDLWTRMMRHYDIAQLPEILVHLRDHSAQITAKHFEDQKEMENQSVLRNIQYLLKEEFSLEDIRALGLTLEDRPIANPEQLKRAADLLKDLYVAVMNRWKLDSKDARIITEDYAKMMRNLALKHTNMRRKGSFPILQRALKANNKAILEMSTLKCILKVIFGPLLISKLKRFLKAT